MAVGKRRDPSAAEIAKIESEITRIRSACINDLRTEWRTMFKKDVPKALTKDLMARMMCFEIQELVYGGFDRATLKLLESYASGRPKEQERHRHLKPGTELIREYQGERHTVIVMEEGFAWQGKTYSSLTTIARGITDTNWNGPRFFGLREKLGVGAAKAGSVSGVDQPPSAIQAAAR